jgi:hypothetical protein
VHSKRAVSAGLDLARWADVVLPRSAVGPGGVATPACQRLTGRDIRQNREARASARRDLVARSGPGGRVRNYADLARSRLTMRDL